MITVVGRKLIIPDADKDIGYQNDNLVETVQFAIPKMYGDIDMSAYTFRVDTEVRGIKNYADLTSQVVEDNIILTWAVSENDTIYPGTMEIQVRAFNGNVEAWQSSVETVKINSSINATEQQTYVPTSLRVIETTEAARVAAEELRASAELLRDSAEDDRIEAESLRDSAEDGRVSAESSRVGAEELRVSAENLRNLSKGPRISKALMCQLYEGKKSCVIQYIGDSLGVNSYSWQKTLGVLLGQKFPGWNVKMKSYDLPNNRYGAWEDLANNGAERHIIMTAGSKTPLQLKEGDMAANPSDLDISFRIALDDWQAINQYPIAKYGSAGYRSWFIMIDSNHRFNLYWSANGTDMVGTNFNGNLNTTALVNGTAYWFRFTLDVDNGAGAYVAKAYTSSDGVVWTTVSTITGGSTTAVFYNAAQPYALGGGSTAVNAPGKYYEVRMRNGIDGRVINPQPIESWNDAANDDASGGINMGGLPTVYIYNASIGGYSPLHFKSTTLLDKVIPYAFNPYLFISLGHNDSYTAGKLCFADYVTMLTEIKNRLDYPMICWVTENPVISSSVTHVEISRKKHIEQIAWANFNNIEVIDTYIQYLLDPRGLAALVGADGLHPNADGHIIMRNTVWNFLNLLNL